MCDVKLFSRHPVIYKQIETLRLVSLKNIKLIYLFQTPVRGYALKK